MHQRSNAASSGHLGEKNSAPRNDEGLKWCGSSRSFRLLCLLLRFLHCPAIALNGLPFSRWSAMAEASLAKMENSSVAGASESLLLADTSCVCCAETPFGNIFVACSLRLLWGVLYSLACMWQLYYPRRVGHVCSDPNAILVR